MGLFSVLTRDDLDVGAEEKLNVCLGVLKVLILLNAKGISHRIIVLIVLPSVLGDLNPRNILLSRSNNAGRESN